MSNSTSLGVTVTSILTSSISLLPTTTTTSTTTTLASLFQPFTEAQPEPSIPTIFEAPLPSESIGYSGIFLIVLACLAGSFLIGAGLFACLYKRTRKVKGQHEVKVESQNNIEPGTGYSSQSEFDQFYPVRRPLPTPPVGDIPRVNSSTSINSLGYEPSPLRNSFSKIDQDGIYVATP